ncbi:esterase/lipase family protein [Bacillus sp. JJ722]|uniref:esterase/lipase family protein n=1 Tax=Bacillus sp. JJ722 TaxID=3122973 RepID=UPI002FFE0736
MSTYHNNKPPLVFVPGLFGSMSDVIIPGTGYWSFGIAEVVYNPFIDVLESMNYQRNSNLFISFYDWRQPVPFSAYAYLAQTISEAKQKTGSNQVNLVCHSMGGLVARAYVQSNYYQDDVDQLIILCSLMQDHQRIIVIGLEVHLNMVEGFASFIINTSYVLFTLSYVTKHQNSSIGLITITLFLV